jgi:guanosine-3',5'-bis(diphosphate) 3'-pyrophosphohydrolase
VPNLAYDAMVWARELHKDQRRKYTGCPYVDHLAEVAGIASTVAHHFQNEVSLEEFMAVCWLHDCVEDQGVKASDLDINVGPRVADAVLLLSDTEVGNRAQRKALSRQRLAQAPAWVQTIKCADLISNTSSIVEHDPKFAVTYLEEKRLLLDVLTLAHPLLWTLARTQCALCNPMKGRT